MAIDKLLAMWYKLYVEICRNGGTLLNIFLNLAFLFFIGSCIGWGIELLYRRFFSKNNPEHKWINPGFCIGPYLPIYGFGLCIMYLIASLEKYSFFSSAVLNRLLLFFIMAACMTLIEFIAGFVSLKVSKVRLWDYSDAWGNILGIICPKFSLIWAALGAFYYFVLHPNVISAVLWLSENLAFSFFIGAFFGVFIIDVVYSSSLVAKLKRFAEENEIVLRLEMLKAQIKSIQEKNKKKHHFLFPFRTDRPLREVLHENKERLVSALKRKK